MRATGGGRWCRRRTGLRRRRRTLAPIRLGHAAGHDSARTKLRDHAIQNAPAAIENTIAKALNVFRAHEDAAHPDAPQGLPAAGFPLLDCRSASPKPPARLDPVDRRGHERRSPSVILIGPRASESFRTLSLAR